MSSSSANASAALDVSSMTTAELRLHVERCERLLQNPTLLKRLKDRGEGIEKRFGLFTEELARRAEAAAAEDTAIETAAKKLAHEAVAADESQVELYGEVAAQRLISEKYKDRRVPVEAIARRMYEGTLSEREIQRILSEVPPSYFLTSAETQEMLRKSAREARRRELEALKQQMALSSEAAPAVRSSTTDLIAP